MCNYSKTKETYHRAIKPSYEWWSTKENRLTSALFKDSNGLSVDKKSDRSIREVQELLNKNHPEAIGDVVIPQELCEEHKCRIECKPIENDEFHHEILGEESIRLSNKVAKAFAIKCSYNSWENKSST